MKLKIALTVLLAVSLFSAPGCASNPTTAPPSSPVITVEGTAKSDAATIYEKLNELEKGPTPEEAYAYDFNEDTDVNAQRERIRQEFIIPKLPDDSLGFPPLAGDGKPPVMPQEAQINDESGALAFAEHYIDSYLHASNTGNVSYLRTLGEINCEGCNIINRRISLAYNAGFREYVSPYENMKYGHPTQRDGTIAINAFKFIFDIPKSIIWPSKDGGIDEATLIMESRLVLSWKSNAWFASSVTMEPRQK